MFIDSLFLIDPCFPCKDFITYKESYRESCFHQKYFINHWLLIHHRQITTVEIGTLLKYFTNFKNLAFIIIILPITHY